MAGAPGHAPGTDGAHLVGGDLDEALASYADARRIRDANGTLETPGGAALVVTIGNLRAQHGDLDGAQADLEEACRIRRSIGTLRTFSGAMLMTNMGNIQLARGDVDGALASYEESRGIHRSTRTLHTPEGTALELSIHRIRAPADFEVPAARDEAQRGDTATSGLHSPSSAGTLRVSEGEAGATPAKAEDSRGGQGFDGTGSGIGGSNSSHDSDDPLAALAGIADTCSARRAAGTLATAEGIKLLSIMGRMQHERGDHAGAHESHQEAQRIWADIGKRLGAGK